MAEISKMLPLSQESAIRYEGNLTLPLPSVISLPRADPEHTPLSTMNALSSTYPGVRATRARPSDATPVVLRAGDGHRASGRLEVVSLTGGLLSLSQLFNRGSCVRLMFLTQAGPVLAPAEMLPPVSWAQQPFRFLPLCQSDQLRLGTAIQNWLGQTSREQAWIQKYRAAALQRKPSRRSWLKTTLAAIAASALALAGAIYILNLHF